MKIILGKSGLKNKSDAINSVIHQDGEELLKPELRHEYAEKLQCLEKKGKFSTYKSISSLRQETRNI